MAERFKRRRATLRLPDAPSVDFMSAGRAQAAAASSVAQAVGKMADFALQRQQEKEYLYGVENAPTAEQIDVAMSAGGALDLPKGDIARAAALEAINNNMEKAALNELALLKADPNSSDLTVPQYSDKINAVIDGFASVLEESAAPKAALKFRAKMGATGNQYLVSFAKEQSSRAHERNRSNDFEAANAIMNSFEGIVSGGAVVSEFDGQVTSPLDIIASHIFTINELPNITATERQNLVKAANQKKIEVVTQAVADWVVSAPGKNIPTVLAGEVDDPNVEILLGSLSDVERRQVVMKAVDQVEENDKVMRDYEASIERKRAEKTSSLKNQASLAYVTNDEEGRSQAMDMLREHDSGAFAELSAAFDKEGGVDNPEVITALRIKSARGDLTLDDVVSQRSGMSSSTFASLLGNVEQNQRSDHKMALDKFRAYIGIVPGTQIVAQEKQKMMAQAEDALNMAVRNDPSIDRVEFSLNYIDTYLVAQKKQAQDEARAGIENSKKMVGIGPGEETDDEFAEAVRESNNAQFKRRNRSRLITLGIISE